MARGGLFGQGFDMHEVEPSSLETLKLAEIETIKEIIRQAEAYLDSQLSAGIAADSRATAFSSILAAALAVMAAGAGSLLIAGPKYQTLVFPYIPLFIYFLAALWSAVQACKPSSFDYKGNNPDQWIEDSLKDRNLRESLAEQAIHYASSITDNNTILAAAAENMRKALLMAFCGVLWGLFGVVLMFFLVVRGW